MINITEEEKSTRNLIIDKKNENTFYQVIREETKGKEEKFLKKKKHKKHKKKHKKKHSSSSERSTDKEDKGVDLEKLRRERLEREEKEKKRIQVLLEKINNKEK
jgi:hypothetical protein